jgi:hypothetical protein
MSEQRCETEATARCGNQPTKQFFDQYESNRRGASVGAMRIWVAAIIVAFGLCHVRCSASAQTLVGSNLFWYKIDQDQCVAGHPTAARDRYPVIEGYGTPDGRRTIDGILASMWQHGQRAVALGLFHEHGSSQKSILDSTDGKLSADAKANLSSLIDTVVKLKYQVLYLRFFPYGKNFVPVSADNTLSLQPALYTENLSFILDVLHLARQKPIEVITDLCNECSPTSASFDNKSTKIQARLMIYTRQLWKDYVHAAGAGHTVGFSIIPDKFRIQNIPKVYELGGIRPQMLDLHFYPSATELNLLQCRAHPGGSECEAVKMCSQTGAPASCHAAFAGSLFDDVVHELAAVGFNIPWVVGETFYNDAKTANYLKTGIALTHQEIKYIFQWPLIRPDEQNGQGDACADTTRGGGVNVAAPTDGKFYSDIVTTK